MKKTRTSRNEQKRYEGLSPFELKNKLIAMAKERGEKMMLNAGRGNPNWVAMVPRKAYAEFLLFAVSESERSPHRKRLGNVPGRDGIAGRLREFLRGKTGQAGPEFLEKALAYVESELKIEPDDFVLELCDAVLGDHYPTPDRMLALSERIVLKYLEKELGIGGNWRLFATEGGTAAMDYIFYSLKANKLSHLKDKIALGTPIFTPYLEIPRLDDYEFVELNVEQDENNDWQYPDTELKKLEDPAVKAFFLVNPSNPTSVAMQQRSLEKLARLVETKRPDLIILTDDVYGTFVNGFRSLAAAAPRNTILVYSFSKYFGATGWRAGSFMNATAPSNSTRTTCA
jgi:aspartate 4-decarboxylase